MFHQASYPSLLVFMLVCTFVVTAFLRGLWISARPQGRDPLHLTLLVGLGLLLWLAAAGGLVASGWLEGGPRRLIVLGGAAMTGSLILGFSPLGKWLAVAVPIPWLLAFQGFRLPLEWVLHSWVHQGVIPETMTWTGSNWDILSGIAALGLAPLSRRFRAAAWAGNTIGIILLINVVRVATFSAPLPFGWQDVTPKLLLPYHLPYALIVPVCIGGALTGHVILTRALLLAKR
jgi:hypothetical protein